MTSNTFLRNINVMNLGLSALILYFAYFLLFPLMDLPVAYSLPPVKPSATGKTETEPPLQQTLNSMEYTQIADQNLFHPERIIPPEKKAEAPLPKPEFVLYGTLITSDLGIAYLEDKKGAPVTTPGRGKRQTAIKKGESLSGFILKELFNDRVVMNRGEETMTVYLNDSQTPKAREGVPDQTKTAASPRPRRRGRPPPFPVPGSPRQAREPPGPETRSRPTASQTPPSTAGPITPGNDEWSSLVGDPGCQSRNPRGLYPLKAPIPAGAFGPVSGAFTVPGQAVSLTKN